MDNHLFRISTKRTDVWSRATPKPVYFVAESKGDAEQWATNNLRDGLSVSKITWLGKQVGGCVFSGG